MRTPFQGKKAHPGLNAAAGSLLAVLVAVSLAAAACGGSSGAPSDATTSAETPALPSPVPVQMTPFPTPEVAGQTYRFPAKGYAVNAPDGWNARPNHFFDALNGRFPTDAFFFPQATNGVQPNITVECLKPRDDQATTDQFRDGWGAFIAQLTGSQPTPRAMTLAGQPAYAFDYTQKLTDQTGSQAATSVDKTDVVAVQGGCRWQVSYTTPQGSANQYRPVFDRFLASFKFLPST